MKVEVRRSRIPCRPRRAALRYANAPRTRQGSRRAAVLLSFHTANFTPGRSARQSALIRIHGGGQLAANWGAIVAPPSLGQALAKPPAPFRPPRTTPTEIRTAPPLGAKQRVSALPGRCGKVRKVSAPCVVSSYWAQHHAPRTAPQSRGQLHTRYYSVISNV